MVRVLFIDDEPAAHDTLRFILPDSFMHDAHRIINQKVAWFRTSPGKSFGVEVNKTVWESVQAPLLDARKDSGRGHPPTKGGVARSTSNPRMVFPKQRASKSTRGPAREASSSHKASNLRRSLVVMSYEVKKLCPKALRASAIAANRSRAATPS